MTNTATNQRPSLLWVRRVLITALVLWLVWLTFKAPPQWENPPIFTGAQGLQRQDYGDGRWEPQGEYVMKRITYTSSASVASILDFYAHQVQANRCNIWSATNLTCRWDRIYMPPLPNTYFLFVVAKPAADGQTSVDVEIAIDPN